MLLPQTAEYALRAMAHLARVPSGVAVRAADLAGEIDVPVHYLSKVLRRLVGHGLLNATKGHGGGFTLAMSPEHIRFIDVLRASGFGVSGRSQCAFGWGACNLERPCPLHTSWSKLNELFMKWTTETTLADTLESGTGLRPPTDDEKPVAK